MASSWTQTDLDALEGAIKSGITHVQFADRSVTYRSLDDMLKLRDIIQKELGLTTSNQTHYSMFRKGPRPGTLPGTGRHRSGF